MASGALRAALRAARRAHRAGIRVARRLRARVLPAGLRFVYHEGYRAPPNDVVDPRRAEKILTYLGHEGWLDEAAVLAPPRLGIHPLVRVHARDYLESIDQPEGLARACAGLSLTPEAALRVVEGQRRATAGTVLATALALRAPQRGPVANLGGGFHHARREHGAGFCIFNDVAVAIEEARARGFRGRVLVVDLDLHHGDGTRSIFADDDRVFTYSVHAAHWDTTPAVATLDLALGPGVGDATYLQAIEDTLPEVFGRARPDLVIYVAGVDVAAGDRLGAWRIGPDAILHRDERVLELARGLPTVIVLAGGYGPEAWRHSARTFGRLLGGGGEAIPSEAETSLLWFRRLRTRIDPAALVADDPPDGDAFAIRESDLLGDLIGHVSDPRLLGYYSRFRLELVIEHYGLADHFRKRGYANFEVDLRDDGPIGPTAVVYADRSRREVLLELSVTEQRLPPPTMAGPAAEGPFRMASIEWLLLQDPQAAASPERPLLPGQKHPGLGCLRIVIGMVVMACERLGLDGVSYVPSQFHVAAQGRSLGTFYEPDDEGAWIRIDQLARGRSIAEMTAAIAGGTMIDPASGEQVRYRPARMVLPVSRRLKTLVGSPAYTRAVEDAARARGVGDGDAALSERAPGRRSPRPPEA